jgi:hypothetical protein
MDKEPQIVGSGGPILHGTTPEADARLRWLAANAEVEDAIRELRGEPWSLPEPVARLMILRLKKEFG